MNFLSFDINGHPSQAIYDVINYQGNRLKKVAADNNDSFSGFSGGGGYIQLLTAGRLKYFERNIFL